MDPNTDIYIKAALSWCHANPITVTLLLAVATAIAKRTKTDVDDSILARIKRMLGRGDGTRSEG